MDFNTTRSYENKSHAPLRKPEITNPNVPPVPQEILDAYSRLILEEHYQSIWTLEDNERYVMIAKFDLLSQTRQRLANLAAIIKRPLENYLSSDEIEKAFLTVEALFWYHLDFYQSVIGNELISIECELSHFLSASSVDHAIFFVNFPQNLDYLETLIRSNENLRNPYDNGVARLENYIRASGGTLGEATLGHQMGFIYRRFQEVKTQVSAVKEFTKNALACQKWQQIMFLIDHFEKSCGLILSARVELISIFNALSLAQENTKSVKKAKEKAYAPLEIIMDRRQTLDETVKQMQSNSKVRYNQALFKVVYKPKRLGKSTKLVVTKQQVSLSIFSRHLALLEIIFPKKTIFGRTKQDSWSYRLMRPLISLDLVEICLVPETEKTVNFVELRIDGEIFIFQCEDQKHRKDLYQQFRLIKQEACPHNPKKLHWRLSTEERSTSSENEMFIREQQGNYAHYHTKTGEPRERPDIKLCDPQKFKSDEMANTSVVTTN